MKEKKKSDEEQILRCRFLKYLIASLLRFKGRYCERKKQELTLELMWQPPCDATAWSDSLLPEELFGPESSWSLRCLNGRERYALLAHAVDGKSYAEIATAMGLHYKGAAALYYRAVKKVRIAWEVE